MSDDVRANPARSAGEAVRRGFLRRCPKCGRGPVFRNLLRMNSECDVCRYGFEREPGYYLGSTYVNYGFTAGFTTFAFVAFRFGLQVPREWLLSGLAVFCVVFPVCFFSIARSLWLNLDCYLDPVGAGLRAESAVGNENVENS